MANINNLLPTGGGSGPLSRGCSTKDLGRSRSLSLSYSGETFGQENKKKKYSVPIEADPVLIASHYKDCVGSLYWLHEREPIAWPFNVVCLGYSGGDDVEYLTKKETSTIVAQLLTIFDVQGLANKMSCSKACISNWKRGATRAPIELREFANNHKGA